MGSNLVDDIDCGNFFDQIDDLIEFFPENDCDFSSSDGRKDAPSTQKDDSFLESSPLFCAPHSNAESDLSAHLSVPYEDIVQLEWLSTFMDDSFSDGGMTIGKENLCVTKEVSYQQFQTLSPVSVLESSSSSSSSGERTGLQSPTQRARSKRPRPAAFSPRTAIQLISSFPKIPQPLTVPQYSSESFTGLTLPVRPAATETKTKKRKIKAPLAIGTQEDRHNPPALEVRKCKHCEITKTPQWRAGPTGPKTLCNACGVRYKSGRLFPEYRPAASPTFVPSVHSNSHKKVVEMRSSKVVSVPTAAIAPATNES